MTGLAERVADAVPANWCDPLLTGDQAIFPKGERVPAWFEPMLLAIRERVRAEAATIIEAARKPCVWTQDEECGQWHTECANAFEIIDGTPADNSMVFCCYCGCPIAAIDAARKEAP